MMLEHCKSVGMWSTWSWQPGRDPRATEAVSTTSTSTWSWLPGRASRASESTHVETEHVRLHRTLKRIAKARAHLDAQEAAALRDAQRTRLWLEFGYTSLVDYMERELGYTPRAAVERLRVANAIEALPQIEAALDQGTLSFSGARELTRIVTPETQEAWLDAAQDKNVRQIEEMVAGHKPGDTPTDPVDDRIRTKVLRFEVQPDTAALVHDYQKKRTRQLGSQVEDDVLLREVFQLALDRLVEERRRPTPASDGSEGEQVPTAPAAVAKPRHQIALTVCEDCKRGWLNAAGTMTLVPPAQLACAQCDCDEIGRVDIVGETRKRSSIPPAMKRKVLARDGHRCCVPGCRSTNIDVHHIEWWMHGGTHHELNLITLCEAHHHAIHDGTLVLSGTPPNVTFTFVAANRFALQAHVVETKRALEKRGYSKQEAIAAVEAVRARAGEQPMAAEEWLRLALCECEGRTTRKA